MGAFAGIVMSVGRTWIPGPELYWMSDWDR